MTPRAAKPCPTPGCPALLPCPEHTPPAWAGSTRRSRLPRGWERTRRTVLHRDPICTECGERPSTEVDHIQAGDDHHISNLRGICTPCHRTKSGREGRAARGRA